MDTTSLLWIISLFISIISVGIFLYLSYRHRQKLDRLQQQMNLVGNGVHETFFARPQSKPPERRKAPERRRVQRRDIQRPVA